ncbi:MAG TPA: ribosomal protein L7/L12 [Mycoplasmatales bacterium]|jgi:ribosomal protein L7/L12|nr:ribosomal protein L7/L12 [Mycoplasmatales bacterium]
MEKKEKAEYVVNAVKELTQAELKYVNDRLKEEYDINEYSEVKEEKKETNPFYTIKLISFGEQKIKVYKSLMEIMNFNIKDVKSKTDILPCTISSQVNEEKANEIKNKLEKEGANVVISKN